MDDDAKIISEEQAAAIWLRAAELQAQAAQHADSPHAPEIGEHEQHPEGYRLAQIRDAAVAAGIAPEFVSLALIETETGSDARSRGARSERIASHLVGTKSRAVEVVRVIPAAPDAVLEAMTRVLLKAPYQLGLVEASPAAPGTGGVFVFDVPAAQPFGGTFASDAATMLVKHLRFVLRPVGADGAPACEVRVGADLGRSVRFNMVGSIIALGGSATIGGVSGASVGILLGAAGFAAVLPALCGALLVGGGADWGLRAMYRAYARRVTKHLEELLRRLEADVRTRGMFAPPARGELPAAGDAGLDLLL